MVKATVVIPTYNRLQQLQRTLLSLNDQSCGGVFEALIVDDGSAADVKAIIDALPLEYPWTWHWQPHAGFRAALARNTGILFSAAETIIFLDDDMVVQRDFIEAHLDFHDNHDESVAIGLRQRVPFDIWNNTLSVRLDLWETEALPDPRLKVLKGEEWRSFPWAYFNTCNASVGKQALFDAGLFDETFVGWGFEDTELAYRLNKIGLNFAVLFESVPYHLEVEKCHVTKNELRYALPPDKVDGYMKNGERFAGKYPDDYTVQLLFARDRMMRMLACKGVDLSPGAEESQKQFGSSEEAENTSLSLSSIPSIFDMEMPAELSLMTPYDEAEEEATTATTTLSSAAYGSGAQSAVAGPSLLEELERDFGIKLAPRRRFKLPEVPPWVWTILLSPIIAIICVLLVGAMVFTGRYRKLFRKARR
jgi:GT2 family glycosyltransferase